MHTTMKTATSWLPVLLAVGWSVQAQGQTPPTYYSPGSPSSEPAPAEPTAAQPAAPAPQAQLAPATAPSAGASASGSWSFASGFDGDASGSGSAGAKAPMSDEQAYQWRLQSLKLHNNIYGSTGLLRISDAGSGAEGTFRIALLADWFTTSSFLCTEDRPCGKATEDDATHFGTSLSLSVTPLPYLEAFASFRSFANSNSEGRPELLQVLGDSIIGLKAFTPAEPNKLFRFGGEAQLLLLNGTGGVGLDGKGTGLRLRALSTVDFAAMEDAIPMRIYGNLGYRLDNSAQVVADTEEARGNMPITRIERFGLGINRTDFVEIGLGVEGTFEYIRPFLAYTVDLPLNRQDYVCHKGKATTRAFHDACLGENQTFAYMPSRLTIGARGYPVLKGFAPMAALDIGVTGTSDFLEEVAPQAPWTLYFGLGYAFDTAEPEPIVKTQQVEKVVQLAPPPQFVIRGKVFEKGTTTPVANAIITLPGSMAGGFATGSEGVFETRSVQPGAYTLSITAEGYHPGQCTAQVETRQSAQDPFGVPPSPSADASATASSAPIITEITCELEALPRMGNIVGRVMDAATSSGVANASVVVTDAQGKEHRVTTDGSGNFRLDGVVPGAVKVQTEAEKYLLSTESANVEPRKDAQVNINLNARPKQSNVVVTQTQIIIRKQINFETDSAVIKGDSTSLMQEIADVIARNPSIKLVEVQGHTDNTGTREHNQELSERRANAVKDWLVANGIEASRLEATGYGQTRPIAPNVTAANRAKNRRVQFVIKERQ